MRLAIILLALFPAPLHAALPAWAETNYGGPAVAEPPVRVDLFFNFRPEDARCDELHRTLQLDLFSDWKKRVNAAVPMNDERERLLGEANYRVIALKKLCHITVSRDDHLPSPAYKLGKRGDWHIIPRPFSPRPGDWLSVCRYLHAEWELPIAEDDYLLWRNKADEHTWEDVCYEARQYCKQWLTTPAGLEWLKRHKIDVGEYYLWHTYYQDVNAITVHQGFYVNEDGVHTWVSRSGTLKPLEIGYEMPPAVAWGPPPLLPPNPFEVNVYDWLR